jgi:hypothetical protein
MTARFSGSATIRSTMLSMMRSACSSEIKSATEFSTCRLAS